MINRVIQSERSASTTVLGIDIGSVSLSLVQMDMKGKMLKEVYLFHKGQIRNSLLAAGSCIDFSDIHGIACTGSSFLAPDRIYNYNPQVAMITATKQLCAEARSILWVGAEKFMLIRFDRTGTYESTKKNSSCAAGTGSFLDQQAFRLNLKGIEEVCRTASCNSGPVPEIASRCAVFAKTDLIHAQQQGYPLEAICDSLCKGLAKNIVDTLFNREPPASPILITGGVARNPAVIRHLETQLNTRLLQHEHSHLFGAIGACFLLLKEKDHIPLMPFRSLEEIVIQEISKKEYFHEPLTLNTPGYPEFRSADSWSFTPRVTSHRVDVQVDLYKQINRFQPYSVYLGIDIGSTSTKAILMDKEKVPLAGFYTYTSGRPFDAVRAIFETLEDLIAKKKISLTFIGVGTTGSGRKFIGKIIGADLIIDEITAHARAAFELNPKTDTIIEIGGQDSKFTLMKDGMVTFSQMNDVCAAGTGSFIEEQAEKLGCTLSEYSSRTEGVRAPLSSDRCTVFMERDINQLLNKGYSVNEILATTIHSVMENYLKKVAIEGSVGETICFQGATAKNKSLVAAFEQKLKKNIFVSEYCHLTGGMGVALLLEKEKKDHTSFRGTSIYQETIPMHTEICSYCSNHCRISHATIQGDHVTYGFLCGRDDATKKYVHGHASGFDLLGERRKIFNVKQAGKSEIDIIIGLPASLHLYEELSFWKRFFSNLSIPTVTSENYLDPVKAGKRIAGAEFCAPIDSMYGHVAYLADKVDYIFLPVYLETREKPENAERLYCYYTQYSASLVFALKEKRIHKKIISPLLNFSKGNQHVLKQLLISLKPLLDSGITQAAFSKAFEEAVIFFQERKKKLTDLYQRAFSPGNSIAVVLLGRPYVVLSGAMNKGIPDIFAGMGIKTFFQDMIPYDDRFPAEIEILLKKVPWYYAARILEIAKVAASTRYLYPVLITAFKCAPDSFIIDYFKKLMNLYHKPYLILQIDEHDSNVGYETRIEAAIHAFRNHASMDVKGTIIKAWPILPNLETRINGKTLLFPSWDSLVSPLLVANLRRAGIDARSLHSSDMIIKKSMAHNTGQCLPVNIIAQEFIEYIEKNGLIPGNTILWMTKSWISCNLRFYPYYTKSLLEAYGNGFEKASVYYGELSHLEISLSTSYFAYFAYLLGGLIRKLGCKIRPYEMNKGETDQTIEQSIKILEDAFLGNRSMDKSVTEVVALFDGIRKKSGQRPGVAIFGDLYVRDNDIMNQDLIHAIENAGGEVITTPYTDLVKITIENVLRRAVARGDYFETGLYRVMLASLKILEEKYYKQFKKFIGDKPVINPKILEKNLAKFNINPFHSGESYENILKIFYIVENYPGIRLFVQTNPAFCCPSLVTEAMTHEIKRITGIPVVTLTYDGTAEYKNDVILPYLQ